MFGFLGLGSGIKINDIDELVGKVKIIDVREPYEFKNGHIKTAENIPVTTILSNPEDYISKDEKVYIMCQSGMRSGRVCTQLGNLGYDVVNLKGGMGDYSGKNRK